MAIVRRAARAAGRADPASLSPSGEALCVSSPASGRFGRSIWGRDDAGPLPAPATAWGRFGAMTAVLSPSVLLATQAYRAGGGQTPGAVLGPATSPSAPRPGTPVEPRGREGITENASRAPTTGRLGADAAVRIDLSPDARARLALRRGEDEGEDRASSTIRGDAPGAPPAALAPPRVLAGDLAGRSGDASGNSVDSAPSTANAPSTVNDPSTPAAPGAANGQDMPDADGLGARREAPFAGTRLVAAPPRPPGSAIDVVI